MATDKTRLAILKEVLKRRRDALKLYRPFPWAVEFHKQRAKWRLVVGPNRSGKTLVGAVEFCRAIRGMDPYGKYPREGRAIVIGLDTEHIAELWRKLSEPGAFWCVYDKKLGRMRAVRWDPVTMTLDPEDAEQRDKWVAAEPLLPKRAIKSIKYEDRQRGVPKVVETDGWRISFHSSLGRPPQGGHYNFGWIDEAIYNDQFYYELVRGILDFGRPRYKSVAVWTATPQSFNIQLWEMMQRGRLGDEAIAITEMKLEGNPFVTDEEKRLFASMLTEEEYRVRILGEHSIEGWRIYPRFDPQTVHGVEPFEIPEHWTVYCAVDPGTQYCGTLLAAVDPDDKHLWVYDGCVLRQSDAREWAAAVKRMTNGRTIEAIVIDCAAGRQTPMGYGRTIASEYWRALEEYNVEVATRGPLHGFLPGTNDVAARQNLLRQMMSIRETGPFAGTPKLKIFKGTLPDLERQLSTVRTDPKHPNKRKSERTDLLDCLEYLAAVNPRYVDRISAKKERESYAVWEDYQRRRRSKRHHGHIEIPGLTVG